MPLTQTQRRRYARHTLLPEIGIVGQERLCAAVVAIDADADHEAGAVARDYLERAGLAVTREADVSITVASVQFVDQLAPTQLRHAGAMLAGAFAAVEAIKSLVGVGTAAALPATLRLHVEAS